VRTLDKILENSNKEVWAGGNPGGPNLAMSSIS